MKRTVETYIACSQTPFTQVLHASPIFSLSVFLLRELNKFMSCQTVQLIGKSDIAFGSLLRKR